MNNTASDRNIFRVIEALGLSKDTYVIVGSGVLGALGIQEWNGDVDITVSDEIFEHFKQQGWQQQHEGDKIVLKYNDYDIGVGFGPWSLADLQADALIIQGIPFISLEKILAWKRHMNRPKDQSHIKLIEEYIQNTPAQ